MGVLAYGLNYRTAPIDLRERIAFPEDTLRPALTRIVNDLNTVAEAVIVSTCNRTELYCAADSAAEPEIREWLAENRPVSINEITSASYIHWDQDAARHLMRVASGLDSQVLGEPQIMGQVKSAYEVARDSGTMGPELNLLQQISMRTAKEVRAQTELGRNPISIAFAAVSLAQQIFSDLKTKKALLVGAGETIGLVADHLNGHGIGAMAIANRTLANAEVLAAKYDSAAMQLTDIAHELHNYDIVIASTGSSLPVIGKGAVEAAIRQRKRKPVFMVDIAVPRDIEVEVGELPDVYLYSIDELGSIIEANLAQRRKAAQHAEEFVDIGAKRYVEERRLKQDQKVLRDLRDSAQQIQAAELAKAQKALERGLNPEVVLEKLANNLTNKLIHPPTVAIRQASAAGRSDRLEYLSKLYQLSISEDSGDIPDDQDL
ncbi:MAG: glutamyl-tRNA reductase [Pseudomonadota bacterium]